MRERVGSHPALGLLLDAVIANGSGRVDGLRELGLRGLDEGSAWRMWAEDNDHQLALEASIQ